MSSSEINTVIDNLCGKLGTAKEVLIPELARMCFTRHLANSIFCFGLLIIAAIIIRQNFKIHGSKETCWDAKQNAEIVILVCGIISTGVFVGLWMNVYEAVQWYAAPTAKAFEYILTLL